MSTVETPETPNTARLMGEFLELDRAATDAHGKRDELELAFVDRLALAERVAAVATDRAKAKWQELQNALAGHAEQSPAARAALGPLLNRV